MLKNITIVIFLIWTAWSHASNEARLLAKSSSGQTALFNLGSFDKIRVGDYAIIIKEIHELDTNDLRIVQVAKARNVKINSDSSVWILYKIYDQELLVTGQKYIVLSESVMLNGRVDPVISRTSVVAPKGEAAQVAKETLRGDQDERAKLAEKYRVMNETHSKEYKSNSDFELLDMEEWEKTQNIRYRSALYKSPHQEDFRRSLRLATFEKMVTAYLRKVNDPNFNYSDFYEKQMVDAFTGHRKRSTFNTEYENFLYAQSQKKIADARLYRRILEKGDLWSEDYSDEELHDLLDGVSYLHEGDRKSIVNLNPKRYSIYLDYGLGLSNNQSNKDAGYRRQNVYAIDLGLEVVPFLKHKTLKNFTIEGSGRANKSAAYLNPYNSDINELSLAGGVNWYPFFAPYDYEKFNLFVGTYIRSGVANMVAPSAGENANYTVLALPGFKGGFKYNFKNNISLRIVASMETLKLEQYKSSEVVSVLPQTKDVVEFKTAFGMAVAF